MDSEVIEMTQFVPSAYNSIATKKFGFSFASDLNKILNELPNN